MFLDRKTARCLSGFSKVFKSLRELYMFKKYLIPFLLILLVTCGDKKNEKIYSSKYDDRYKLKIVDSLIYRYEDTVFIGRVHDIQLYNDKILISDFFLKKLWVFTKDLKLIKTVGRQGRGPGEYSYAPNILYDSNFVWLYFNRYLDKYDKNISFVNRYDLPKELVYKPTSPISCGNFFVFNVVYPFSIAEKSYFKKYKPLIKLDINLKNYENFDEWDENYFGDNLEGYTRERHEALITKKDNQHFFSIQGASYLIKLYDEKLNLLKHFGRKPIGYKNPPKLRFKDTQASVDANAEFYSKITIWNNLRCDSKREYLCLGYTNLYKDFYLYRSLMRGEHFLQVFDKNYNVIYDGEVLGKLAFVDDRDVYVISKEDPKYLKILVYRIESR